MSSVIRRRVLYRGRVQGVGFRATVRGLAAGRAVTGYVRNLADGTVELLAEGIVHDVEAFLVAIADRFSRHIEDAHVESLPAGDAPLSGFTIR